VVHVIDGFEPGIIGVRFADPTTALAVDREHLKRIDLKSQEVVWRSKHDCRASKAAAFSRDGGRLALNAGHDLVLFDTRSGREVTRCETGETPWTAVFTPDGKRLLGGGSARISAWDVKTGFKVHQVAMAHQIDDVQTIAVAPDGRHVAGVNWSADEPIQVFRFPEP